MSQPTASHTAGSTLALLERSHESLLEACHSRAVTTRYLQAQLAALRAAAALVAARSVPDAAPSPRSLWDLVPAVAPELSEWADFFAISTARRSAVERGQVVVTARDADDLIRQAEAFAALVARALGLPGGPRHGDLLAPIALIPSASP
jgi:hypothetical protein